MKKDLKAELLKMLKSIKFFKNLIIPVLILTLIAGALLLERIGANYTIKENSIELLPENVIVTGFDNETAEKECAVLISTKMSVSNEIDNNFFEHIKYVFSQIKVGYDVYDIAKDEFPELSNYKTAVITFTDYTVIGEDFTRIREFVAGGGGLLTLPVPDLTPTLRAVSDLLGVKSYGNDYTITSGIRFYNDFMLGTDLKNEWEVDYLTGLDFTLDDDVIVYARSSEEMSMPLISRNNYGEGKVVVCNHGICDKAASGMTAAAYSLLTDYFAYPVINASVYFLDDFPSPVPSGNGDKIKEDYNCNISTFYSTVWWPNMCDLAEKYGIQYTGLMIGEYGDNTEGPFNGIVETDSMRYYGSMLLANGGELGLHGYNHQPLCLEGFKYTEGIEYEPWQSADKIKEALTALEHDFRLMFPKAKHNVYVPPSNVLSDEGRKILASPEFGIKMIASVYQKAGNEYEQNFEVAQDGMIEFPRITSGGILDEYNYWCEMNEMNLHFVNSYFLHPDDALDPDRGSELGWAHLYTNIENYTKWIIQQPELRQLRGTEAGAATQRWYAATLERSDEKDAIRLKINNFYDDVQIMVRINSGVPKDITGGTITKLSSSMYLVAATSDTVVIKL